MVDKLIRMRQLAQGLREAGRNRDWQAIARLDAELAALLRSSPTLWSAAERQALDQLEHAHTQVRQSCATELARLEQTMTQMRSGRERWQAYAQSTQWDAAAAGGQAAAVGQA